ncbi:putative transposase, IS30 family [Photorhabdus asymbiotica]|uniref:Transposase, IS30 family n=1 Tax=Photorhabdus asymbiotica subsp. asymbiotica (strain ATCC 43949 / 3105-77) TaxID=553480 RepID=B6VLQ1_PHOAA|nr:putative transposase, IS30 family [Photorhabdus asymbiotica]CAR67081.1 Hypothetical protein PA-RVA8-2958 [Photorhabdus asymbiotica subsp. asymbiotica ATCC 43949]
MKRNQHVKEYCLKRWVFKRYFMKKTLKNNAIEKWIKWLIFQGLSSKKTPLIFLLFKLIAGFVR